MNENKVMWRTDPTDWAPGWWALHAVQGGQALLQRSGELIREPLPVLLSHLVPEAVQDLQPQESGGLTGQHVNLSSVESASRVMLETVADLCDWNVVKEYNQV